MVRNQVHNQNFEWGAVMSSSGYNHAVKTKRNLIAILLLLLLLMVQQSVVAHTVTHWSDATQDRQEKQLPHEEMCEQCIAFAQFGSSLTSEFSLHVADLASVPQATCQLTQEIIAQSFCVYHSRAPPSA